jgi:hypothetical protein
VATSRYLHAWDHKCRQYLQWLADGRRKIEALLCPDCGQQYPVAGKSAYKLAGGKMCLAAVEARK